MNKQNCYAVNLPELNHFLDLLNNIKDIHFFGYFMMNVTVTPKLYIAEYTFVPSNRSLSNPIIPIINSLGIKYTVCKNSENYPSSILLHIHKKNIDSYINLLKLKGLYSEKRITSLYY